ncbi:ROK family protein [Paenibacillus sp. MMS20-IR301]|uniref:ROK family protein n=1 Tax=Paenibacillus sp. MMS20-IR301 TaxID=2895946 RepID=UPI0028E6A83A|nr:ROK family protein [Paenibacillus sp. MMS20-IR301]WNS46724.1 ROK family protein [Paenibacillus sp. MMS20-IR301]
MQLIQEIIANPRAKEIYFTVRKYGTVSKQTLLDESGLTISTLTRILDELLSAGLLLEVGFGESTGGRRPTLYETNPAYAYLLGLEISRTRARLVLTDFHLRLLDEYTWNMDAALTPERLIESLHQQVLRMLESASTGLDRVAGLGIGAVGPLDRKAGVILNPARFPAPGWSQVQIKAQLEQRLSVPVYLDNGANTALLGEYWAGSSRMQHHLLYLHAGIGLRSAIMNDGRLLYGMIDTEGAAGQMIIEGSGLPPQLPGGNAGAWESYVSVHTLERQAREAWEQGSSTMLRDLAESAAELEFPHLVEALQARDPVAVRLFSEMAVYCGIGLANLINILHPEEVILGGPLFLAADDFYQEATRIALERTYYRGQYDVRFTRSSLGERSVAAGACAMVLLQLTS